MREPRPNWCPLGVNFKILDEHPHLFYIGVPPGTCDQIEEIIYNNKRTNLRIGRGCVGPL